MKWVFKILRPSLRDGGGGGGGGGVCDNSRVVLVLMCEPLFLLFLN